MEEQLRNLKAQMEFTIAQLEEKEDEFQRGKYVAYNEIYKVLFDTKEHPIVIKFNPQRNDK